MAPYNSASLLFPYFPVYKMKIINTDLRSDLFG